MVKLPLYKLFIILLLACIVVPAQAQNEEQYIAVLLRNIGHEFLNEIGDSTSRILEITKSENTYALKFEHEVEFTPDQLYTKVHDVMYKYQAQQNFIVEVSTCDSNKIVHSFKASLNRDEEILSCKGRPLPKACYLFLFTATQPWTPNEIPVEEIKEAQTLPYAIGLGILLLLGSLLWWQKRVKAKKLIELGRYQFDLDRMKLLFQDEVIELSALEAELLHLFIENKNQTLKREYILNTVWEDEGNYVGRTLDVFISKLRKKLENDESLKIISVRGVGYKFVN